jgi:hypothetical protein
MADSESAGLLGKQSGKKEGIAYGTHKVEKSASAFETVSRVYVCMYACSVCVRLGARIVRQFAGSCVVIAGNCVRWRIAIAHSLARVCDGDIVLACTFVGVCLVCSRAR